MKTFTVEVPEIWKRCFTIQANSEEEALAKAGELLENGTEDYFEYSDTYDVDEWDIQDISHQFKEVKK